MKRIRTIVAVTKHFKDKKPYWKTHAILSTGEEVEGFGKKFKVGDLVEYFYHEKWQVAKMVLPKKGKK